MAYKRTQQWAPDRERAIMWARNQLENLAIEHYGTAYEGRIVDPAEKDKFLQECITRLETNGKCVSVKVVELTAKSYTPRIPGWSNVHLVFDYEGRWPIDL